MASANSMDSSAIVDFGGKGYCLPELQPVSRSHTILFDVGSLMSPEIRPYPAQLADDRDLYRLSDGQHVRMPYIDDNFGPADAGSSQVQITLTSML
jgi:hypothetical protein